MVTKEQLLKSLKENKYLAVTGRVESWLKDPESRYPVSCTVLAVEDSMEGESGIEYATLYVSKALRFGAGVALDLSKIRPAGSVNAKGLVASGPVSFMQIFSKWNEILRRGGLYKNGAVAVYLEATHPDIVSFLQAEGADYDWLKKSVYINDDPESEDYILSPKLADTLDLILKKVRAGTVWLSKIRYGKDGKRLYTQVCHEILLQSRGTCLLSHVNLGMTSPNELTTAFETGMEFLCQLHGITGAGKDNYYLPPEKDRQVGLGVIGLANFLAKHMITYSGFANALYTFGEAVKRNCKGYPINEDVLEAALDDTLHLLYNPNSYSKRDVECVMLFYKAFLAAAAIADQYKMDRAFTIAPTATCSYRYKDTLGYTTTPEISPPICHPVTKKAVRDSEEFGTVEYQYPLSVETAEQVGFDTYSTLVQGWQMMMNATGKAHCISFNIWNECPVDMVWFKRWLQSPLVTTYYRMMEQQQYLDKSSITGGLEAAKEAFSNDDDFFMPVDDSEETRLDLDNIFQSCSITPVDDGRCIACGE